MSRVQATGRVSGAASESATRVENTPAINTPATKHATSAADSGSTRASHANAPAATKPRTRKPCIRYAVRLRRPGMPGIAWRGVSASTAKAHDADAVSSASRIPAPGQDATCKSA